MATKQKFQKFRRYIIHYSNVIDIQMILDELLEDLKQKADLKEVKDMIEQKKVEVEKMYNQRW
ncbi:hypothetical protein [Bacillus smithii]|uniref:hypothetical protein n=1 Tax=Bacillus smithii TaxID=1479 RepID=UPI002E1D1023|nr:hypothetical protein [Bacillus smithii]MED1457846.1 hypothetical protein [Bacillus smithii]